MRRFAGCLALTLAAAGGAQAEIRGEPVEYRTGDTVMKGYLAYDDAVAGKRPGVLVVHEWWGHNDHARERARALAALGYAALAVDMYGDGKRAEHPDQAGAFAGEVRKNAEISRTRFQAAMDFLERQTTVDRERIAAIGYCFGGSVVLDMARQGVEGLDAVVSFHGSLGTATPARAGQLKAQVLVLTGADDPMVPPEQVAAFQKEMDGARAGYRVVSYPGVKHSFTNPGADALAAKFGLPLAYDPTADRESWAEMERLLKTVFAP